MKMIMRESITEYMAVMRNVIEILRLSKYLIRFMFDHIPYTSNGVNHFYTILVINFTS